MGGRARGAQGCAAMIRAAATSSSPPSGKSHFKCLWTCADRGLVPVEGTTLSFNAVCHCLLILRFFGA
jgi:hypothetical protein